MNIRKSKAFGIRISNIIDVGSGKLNCEGEIHGPVCLSVGIKRQEYMVHEQAIIPRGKFPWIQEFKMT